MASGVVLTGGLSSMEGAPELAEEVLGLPVRTASPSSVHLGGLVDVVRNPRFSTAVGLLLSAPEAGLSTSTIVTKSSAGKTRGLWKRIRSWAQEVF